MNLLSDRFFRGGLFFARSPQDYRHRHLVLVQMELWFSLFSLATIFADKMGDFRIRTYLVLYFD
jgi:hypothetical protein